MLDGSLRVAGGSPESSLVLVCVCVCVCIPQASLVACNNNNNNNNNRELIERFRNLKALYNLKKNIQCTNTHNYINQQYTSVQNIRKLTSILRQNIDSSPPHPPPPKME